MVVEKLGMAWLDFFKGLGVPPDRLIEAKHEVPCVPHQRNRRLILEWKQNCSQSPDAMFTALTGRLIDTCLEDLLAVLFPMNAPSAAVHISPSTVEPSEASFNGSDQHSENECWWRGTILLLRQKQSSVLLTPLVNSHNSARVVRNTLATKHSLKCHAFKHN